MKHFFPEIYSNRLIAKDFYRLDFFWHNDLKVKPIPGQFVTIKISKSSVPLLRRPFAFSGYHAESQCASIMYQKRGIGTELLSNKEIGDRLDVIGPFGNGFAPDALSDNYLIIAGGTGLGPMVFLANTLTQSRKQVVFILGAQDTVYVPQKEVFGLASPLVCTDNGSEGFRGTTIDYLTSLFNELRGMSSLYACGPKPMLQKCHEFSHQNKMPCQVSIEQVMACGVGACMGCTIQTVHDSNFVRVCRDGPVFDSKDIQWI